MTIFRATWPAAVIASLFAGACGGNSINDPDPGASGGAPTGGSASASTGGSGGGAAGTPDGGSAGGDSAPLNLGELGDCNPLEDTCPEGTYCQLREGRTECIEEGSTERDERCEETDPCQRGSICLWASEFLGRACQQPCPLDEKPWEVCDIGRHTCFVAVDDEDNELPFGVCRY